MHSLRTRLHIQQRGATVANALEFIQSIIPFPKTQVATPERCEDSIEEKLALLSIDLDRLLTSYKTANIRKNLTKRQKMELTKLRKRSQQGICVSLYRIKEENLPLCQKHWIGILSHYT